MEVLKKGTVESLMVALRDRLGSVDDLSTVTGLVFDTKKKSDDAAVESSVACSVDPAFPMTAVCMITTTLAGYTGGEEYKLYVRYTAGSESPVLGPLFFRVEDD
jgi:hypothetical protein